MVKIINSRIAGRKLAWIVAVLLIPIVYMGITIGHQLRSDAFKISQESMGADYLNLVGPVMLDASTHEITATAAQNIKELSPSISSDLGFGLANNSLLLSLSYDKPDHGVVLKKVIELSLLSGSASGITYDSDPESYHVGVITAEYLPNTVLDFYNLKTAVLNASSQPAEQNSSNIILAIGNFSSSTKRFHDAILLAKKVSGGGYDYSDILRRSEQIQNDVAKLSDVGLGMSMGSQIQIKNDLISHINQVNDKWVSDFRFQSEKLRQRLSALIGARDAETHRKILNVLLMSIATIMLGLGSAIAMHRSTLKQLDHVELAKLTAEQARAQAEHMSAELSSINTDMVRVNTELATNMQMLKDAQDALVKKGRMEQMGQLTATIAHELRNPLGAVRTSAFLIERKLKGKDVGVEPQLARINNGVTRCDDIITQLLDFSRSKKLACRSENLDKWLEKILAEEANQLPSAVAIDCTLGLAELQVPFDPSRLQRAIINLVSNASEAMVGNGEDPSRYTVSSPRITITTEADGEFAFISVSDNGPGISPENLVKIREPLFTTKSFGTGLGLPAVDQIVVQHGGTLEVVSTLGLGARFTIKLPLTSAIEDAA